MENPDVQVNTKFLYKKGLCGLRNLGNTCFMNTIIQCLSNTIPLLKYILEKKYVDEINLDKEDSTIVEDYHEMLLSFWKKNSVYSPDLFVKNIQKLAIQKEYSEFTGLRQSDSQDFLQFFLESMHNALSREVNMEIVGIAKNEYDKLAIEALKNFKVFFKNDYSEIVKIFYGQFFTIVKSVHNKKKEISRSFEPFNILTLEINKSENKKITLYSCLDKYTELEEIDIDEPNKSQFKEVKFWCLPDILIINFKRFTNDLSKIDDYIDYPIDNLDMSKYVNGYNRESYIYNLYAIANHEGTTDGGHYWALIKNNDNNWYKFNDNIVSTVSDNDIVSNNAYCLFYIKK